MTVVTRALKLRAKNLQIYSLRVYAGSRHRTMLRHLGLLFACALMQPPSTHSSSDAPSLGPCSRLPLHVSLEHAGERGSGEGYAAKKLRTEILGRGTRDGCASCACVQQRRLLMRLRGAGDRQQAAALRGGESDSEAEEIFRPRVLEEELGADSLDMRARDSVPFESSLRAEQGVGQVCGQSELAVYHVVCYIHIVTAYISAGAELAGGDSCAARKAAATSARLQ